MKNILILFIALLSGIPIQSKCQDLTWHPKIAFDYFAGQYKTKISEPVTVYNYVKNVDTEMKYGSFRVRLGADVSYKGITIYFNQHVYMNKAPGISFTPLQAEWFAGINYSITSKIKIGYEHLCIHPIITDGLNYNKVYGGYNMFSVSYGY